MPRKSMLVGLAICSFTLAAASRPGLAETSVQFGVASSSLQFDFLYRDYGIERVRAERGVAYIGEPDYVVAVYLASLSEVELDVIVRWRRDGASWDAITHRCHLDSNTYYVELPPDVAARPPYGRAYGYWRRHPHGTFVLQDDEIRELACVKALAKHCGRSPKEIVRERAAGRGPKEIAGARGREKQPEDTAPRNVPSQDRGKHGGKHGNGKK